jgi:hypothetical protein
VYMMPTIDPETPNYPEEMEKAYASGSGKPWAIVMYHPARPKVSFMYLLKGAIYSLLAVLIASLLLHLGDASFTSFGLRFLAAMLPAAFTLFQGVLDDMNWWGYPWHFVKPSVIDLTFGWAICAVWLAWYMGRRSK